MQAARRLQACQAHIRPGLDTFAFRKPRSSASPICPAAAARGGSVEGQPAGRQGDGRVTGPQAAHSGSVEGQPAGRQGAGRVTVPQAIGFEHSPAPMKPIFSEMVLGGEGAAAAAAAAASCALLAVMPDHCCRWWAAGPANTNKDIDNGGAPPKICVACTLKHLRQYDTRTWAPGAAARRHTLQRAQSGCKRGQGPVGCPQTCPGPVARHQGPGAARGHGWRAGARVSAAVTGLGELHRAHNDAWICLQAKQPTCALLHGRHLSAGRPFRCDRPRKLAEVQAQQVGGLPQQRKASCDSARPAARAGSGVLHPRRKPTRQACDPGPLDAVGARLSGGAARARRRAGACASVKPRWRLPVSALSQSAVMEAEAW